MIMVALVIAPFFIGTVLLLVLGRVEQAFDIAEAAMFVARDDDTTIYLFGTIDPVPCVEQRGRSVCASGLSTPVIDAILAADEVWLEVADDTVSASLFREFAYRDEGSLTDLISPDELALLAHALTADFGAFRSVHAAEGELASMQPWFISVLFNEFALSAVTSRTGVDDEVERIATTAGIPILGFETVQEQFVSFAADPHDLHVAELRSIAVMIEHGLDLRAAYRSRFSETWDAWRTGRLDKLEDLLMADLDLYVAAIEEESPTLLNISQEELAFIDDAVPDIYGMTDQQRMEFEYGTLVAGRNIRWMNTIDDMLSRSGTFFVAVGALHLAGDQGLLALLEGGGVSVARVQ